MLAWRDEADARSIVYRLLSRAFLDEPTAPFLESMAEPATQRVFSRLGGSWLANLSGRDQQIFAEEMGIEYTRLFLGPGFHVYPYESMYAGAPESGRWGMENQLYGEAATTVEEFYQDIGLAVANSSRWLPDHIGVELECMSHLTGREARSWEQSDLESGASLLRLQHAFLCQHLVPWLPRFGRRVNKFEPHPFYRTMAKAANQFVRLDLRTVEGLLGESLAREGRKGEPRETTTGMRTSRR